MSLNFNVVLFVYKDFETVIDVIVFCFSMSGNDTHFLCYILFASCHYLNKVISKKY